MKLSTLLVVFAVLAAVSDATAPRTSAMPRFRRAFQTAPQVRAMREEIKSILDGRDNDVSKLTASERQRLLSMGFAEGDLAPMGELKMSNKGAFALEKKQEGAPPVFAELGTREDVSTGMKFWYNAFIPGPDSGQSSHLPYRRGCGLPNPPGGPFPDTSLLPAPNVLWESEWFHHDNRGWSTNPAASSRVHVEGELFKRGTGYFVRFSAHYGITRHYEKDDDDCFKISCEKTHPSDLLPNGGSSWDSPTFTSTGAIEIDASGGNPCVFGSGTLAPIIMDFDLEITVSSTGGTLKLGGSKSRFPAMEGYIQDTTGVHTWFQWDIGDRTVMSLMLPTASVDWEPRSFTCSC